MDAIKPGTRCECRDAQHSDHRIGADLRFKGPNQALDCTACAVRIVKVYESHPDDVKVTIQGERPMCAACAEYHESKVTK